MVLNKPLVFNIVSYFPSIHREYIKYSIIGKLVSEGKVIFNFISIIEFANQHSIGKIDDALYGGGNGLLLRVDVLDQILTHYNLDQNLIHVSPAGTPINFETLPSYNQDTFTIICSRYDGIDCRIKQLFEVREVSIGDYVLFDGDIASIILYNLLIRQRFLNPKAKICESFNNLLLECDHYTRPVEYKGHQVPAVLYEGHHKKIAAFRYENSLRKTKLVRSDLYNKFVKEHE